MRVAMVGSRDPHIFQEQDLLQAIQDSGFHITEVLVTGDAGVSELAASWARTQGLPLLVFSRAPDDPRKISAAKRNSSLAEHAEAMVCLHHGTKGTWSLMQEMRLREKPVHEVQRTLPETDDLV